ncbi:MAG TPA: VWA domain-containing protein [Blastocatellia bacterium]|nr:VWA domain-containing protein [Blastocatellia bacterium]
MCKNRIFRPSIITLLAVFFLLVAVRVEQAAQQEPQPDKSVNKASNPQTSDSRSSETQSSGGAAPAKWQIILPKKPQSAGPQSPGAGAQEQKQEQKQESKPTPTPQAPGKQSPMQQLRSQLSDKDDQDRVRIGTELVSLPVTVTDAYNRLVTGLDRHHFEVYEDKVKQEISFFSDDDSPVNLGIVFDVSGSMKGKLDRARDALKAFIQTSHSDDDFFLVGFNQRANLLAEFTDGDALANKLTLVDPKGQTALYDAAYLGIEKVKQGRHNRHALLLISDGQDNSSRYTYGELRKLLKEAGVQIYCIGIVEMGGGAGGTLDMQGQAILEEIAQTTGGKAFFPRSGAELEDATTRIALELRHQYSIGYNPTNVKRDGQWHKIKVSVKGPKGLSNLKVQYKEGYYAVANKGAQ